MNVMYGECIAINKDSSTLECTDKPKAANTVVESLEFPNVVQGFMGMAENAPRF